MIPSVIIFGVLVNVMSGAIVEIFGNKVPMTIPYLSMVKSIADFVGLLCMFS